MHRSTIGAHPASTRTGPRRVALGIALAASVIASLAAAPTVGAATMTRSLTTDSVTGLTVSATDAPWYSVEQYYLKLVNCTRTGGWVLADGTCRGYGSGHYSKYVRPIGYGIGLSNKVSRPYARLLAERNLCSHNANGDPGYRLNKVGYMSWTWGENIGCRDGYSTAKAAVLASHRVFQSEKSSGGGHWRNIKNAHFKSMGIGIWRSGTRTRLVTDFYG